MSAPGRYRTARPALNPCGTGRGEQFECRNIFRECRPTASNYQTAIAPKSHAEVPKDSARELAATTIVRTLKKIA